MNKNSKIFNGAMNRISRVFNFDNIGGKIKNFSKWLTWISILLVWIVTLIAIVWVLGSVALDEVFDVVYKFSHDDASGGLSQLLGLVITLCIGLIIALIGGFIEAMLCSISIWVGGWLAYAFGQLVEDVHTMCYRGIAPAQTVAPAKAKEAPFSKVDETIGTESARPSDHDC